MLLRDDAPATVACPCARSPPQEPKTASLVASAGGPLPAGLGRPPESPDVSADDLCLWTAPDGRDAAAGLGHRPPTHAGPGPTRQRGQRPLCAPGRTDPGAVASVLAARAPPALVVPRPAPANTPVPHLPPKDVQSGGAPEWYRQRCLHPYVAALLCDPSAGTGGVVAGDSGTARPQEPEYHGPLHASDATHLRRCARHHQRPHGRSLRGPEPGHAGGGGRLAALWA